MSKCCPITSPLPLETYLQAYRYSLYQFSQSRLSVACDRQPTVGSMDGLFAEEFDSTLKDDLIDRLSLLCDGIKLPHDDMISTYTSTE